MRRANDVSQNDSFSPSPTITKHSNQEFGTHHARDAAGLFYTLGEDLDLFSSAIKVNSQYMHILWFRLTLNDNIHVDDLKGALYKNPLIAMTTKDMTSSVFSFGRDHGHFGRIFNPAVVAKYSVEALNNNEIVGFGRGLSDGIYR
mgnify:CR=1 FL=1